MTVMERFLALDDRRFYGLVVSAAVLVLAVMISYVLIPQLKRFQKQQKIQATLPSVATQGGDLLNLLKQRDHDIEQKARLLHGDMANLPLREIEAFVMDRVQGVAWNHDVVLEGVKPEGGESIDSFSEILFKLEISGHYNDLFAWLHDLKNELGFIVIKEYEMRRVSTSKTDPILSVRLTIASYRKDIS